MKKLNIIVVATLMIFAITSCNDKKTEITKEKGAEVVEKTETITYTMPKEEPAMSPDSLNIKINTIVNAIITKRRLAIKSEAMTAVTETQALLQLIESGKTKEAIEEGHRLIGKFKVLLLKDPSLSTILVDTNFHKDMLVTDIETVRSIANTAKLEIENKHYQDAATLLNKLKSEIVIQNVLIPAASYPNAIKLATAFLKDGNTEASKMIIQQVLGTLIIEKTILPIPILKAEQFIIAASKIKADTENYSKTVTNLINHADYQLHLAEEMGYGKKNKAYAKLYKSLHDLKDSVMNKLDTSRDFKLTEKLLKELREIKFPAKIN